LLNFLGNGNISMGKKEIIQRGIAPVSFQKTKDDEYIPRTRHWENQIYRYSTIDKGFLFGLNSRNTTEQFYQRILSDPSLNTDVSIIEKDKHFSIEIANINLY